MVSTIGNTLPAGKAVEQDVGRELQMLSIQEFTVKTATSTISPSSFPPQTTHLRFWDIITSLSPAECEMSRIHQIISSISECNVALQNKAGCAYELQGASSQTNPVASEWQHAQHTRPYTTVTVIYSGIQLCTAGLLPLKLSHL